MEGCSLAVGEASDNTRLTLRSQLLHWADGGPETEADLRAGGGHPEVAQRKDGQGLCFGQPGLVANSSATDQVCTLREVL